MRNLALLVAASIALAACAGSDVSSLTPTEYPYYQIYLKQAHYKAFVRAKVTEDQGLFHYPIYQARDLEAAISHAMEYCTSRLGAIAHAGCQLHSLGNVDVSRLNEEELARAIAVYKRKRDFTSADLPAAFERNRLAAR